MAMIHDDEIRLGFACPWTKDRAKTWSHTPLSFLRALQGRTDVRILDLPINVGRVRHIFHRLLFAKLHHGRIVSTWRYSSGIRKAQQRSLQQAVGSGIGMDAVLSMFDFSILPIPQFIYQDYSCHHMLHHYKTRGQFPELFDIYRYRTIEKCAALQQPAFDSAAGILSMSEWHRRVLINMQVVPEEKIVSVGAGTHIPVKPPANDRFAEADAHRQRKILFIGRSFFVKAGDVVVNAVQHLYNNADYQVKLVLAGPRKWPLSGSVPKWVQFLGDAPHHRLREELKDSDVLALPSRFEGYGIAILEALAAGVPVVGRNDFAMPEFVIPGTNGDLVNSDDPVELAEKLDRTMNSTAIRIETARRARMVSEHYSWERVANDTMKFILHRLQQIS